MKKVLNVLIAVVFLVTASTAFAGGEEVMQGMGEKLKRGAVNTFTGWVEVPAQIAKGYKYGFMGKDNDGVIGAIGGIFAGIGSAAGRTISGLGELSGFWAADPASNDGIGIPLDAEYAWEEGTSYDMVDPDFETATFKPIIKKLGRGLLNTGLGVLEVPGQIMKGIEERSWDLGIIKGVWYALSRTVDGIWDLATFPLPGPADTKGEPFDEEWPWSAMVDRQDTESTQSDTESIK